MCRTASPSEGGLAAFDDDVQGWQRRAAGGADASSICGEVASLSSPFPCDDVDGAVDAKCDHGHGVRPDRPSGRVVASQLVICSPGFARRSRATCQEVVQIPLQPATARVPVPVPASSPSSFEGSASTGDGLS
jgi:hypothetical protein